MISIIVPIYNAEHFLTECIESILNQSYTDIELILVNDGSTDNSFAICRSFSDTRIVLINKKNGGVSSARNAGINIAKGEYITFVDSDDTLPPKAIETLFQSVIAQNADIVIGLFQYQYENKFVARLSRVPAGIYNYESLLADFIDDGTLSGFLIGSACGALYKSSIIQQNTIRFVEGLKNNEDGVFNFEFALNAQTVSFIDCIVYNYRQIEITYKTPCRLKENYGKKVFDYLDTLTWNKERYSYECQKHRRYVTLAWWNILSFCDRSSFGDSVKYIKQSLCERKVIEGMSHMQICKMNLYKRIFFYMMKYHAYIIMFVSLKYLVPLLKNRLRR